jgi:hypothetical protein
MLRPVVTNFMTEDFFYEFRPQIGSILLSPDSLSQARVTALSSEPDFSRIR